MHAVLHKNYFLTRCYRLRTVQFPLLATRKTAAGCRMLQEETYFVSNPL
jgi:hypothetical protein